MNKKIFRLYQWDIFKYDRRERHPANFVDMRLGKTLVTLRECFSQRPAPQFVLVVAPYSALNSWEQEAACEGIPVTWLVGTRVERLAALDTRVEGLCLINTEGHLSLPEIAYRKWDVLIIDESTIIKNPGSKVTKFFCRNFRNVKKRYILSGTPAPESSLDLFTQLNFMDENILGRKNYWHLRTRWCEPGVYGYRLTPEGKAFLESVLAAHCFSLTRKQAGYDVPMVFERRVFQLPKNAEKMYRQAVNEFAIDSEAFSIKTIFAMAKWHWLRQICSGQFMGQSIHNEKMDILLDLLSGELKNEQVVVFAAYTDEIKWIQSTLFENGFISDAIWGDIPPMLRKGIISRFNKKESRILVIQPEVVTFGENLSSSDTGIFFSSPVRGITRQQVQNRIVDVMKKGVLLIDIVAMNTVEEDILESHSRKETEQELVRRMMKRITKREF